MKHILFPIMFLIFMFGFSFVVFAQAGDSPPEGESPEDVKEEVMAGVEYLFQLIDLARKDNDVLKLENQKLINSVADADQRLTVQSQKIAEYERSLDEVRSAQIAQNERIVSLTSIVADRDELLGLLTDVWRFFRLQGELSNRLEVSLKKRGVQTDPSAVPVGSATSPPTQ